MERHSFSFDHHDLFWLDNLSRSRLDPECGSVKMFNLKISSNNGVKKGDFFGHQNICSFPFKDFMLLLSHNENNITGLFYWVLIGLTVESILFAVWGTFINSNLNDFLLFSGDIRFTLFDNSISSDSNLHVFSIVKIFKCAFNWMDHRLCFLWSNF